MTLAVSTGVDSFGNPSELGPLYPFVGAEWFFLLVSVLLWLAWHVAQARLETKDNDEAAAMYERIGLDRAMYYAGSADIPTDDEWERSARVGAQPVATASGAPAAERDSAHEAPGSSAAPAT